jgi:hypothetical protein
VEYLRYPAYTKVMVTKGYRGWFKFPTIVQASLCLQSRFIPLSSAGGLTVRLSSEMGGNEEAGVCSDTISECEPSGLDSVTRMPILRGTGSDTIRLVGAVK